jgi:predicted acylesterase/phospholipase RssA
MMNLGHTTLVATVSAALLLAGCAHQPPRFDPKARRTCLVLSSGGTRGVAELGAVEAVRRSHLPIGCVVGTSVGALVGGLYASAPQQDTTERFSGLTSAYVAETQREAGTRGVGAGLALGALAAALSGGVLVPATAALGGFLLGAATTTKAALGRFERVLAAELDGAQIETLPVPFATLHHERAGEGLRLIVDRSGQLSRAIAASIANPFVFDDVDVTHAAALDPGSDRIAATPVNDACRLFPDSNLLVVNVSGTPAIRDGAGRCAVREVMIEVADLAPEAIVDRTDAFEQAWQTGFERVSASLRD